MSKGLVLVSVATILVTVFTFHFEQVSAFPAILSGDDGGPVSILVDPDEYDDYAPPAVLMKRFFTNHPSDYNPMRRPGPIPRGSKREDGIPFHPVPRVVSGSMRGGHHGGHGSEEFGVENSDGYIESGRQKKQTRAATLIFRLGSLGMRRKPTVPPGPTA